MCTPSQQVSATLRRAGNDSLSSRTTARQSQFIDAFDRIVAPLSDHPVDDGIFWDSIDSDEYHLGHVNSFQRALRNSAFRDFAARYPQSRVNDNIWNAITRKYPNMSQEHRGIVNVFMHRKVEDALTGQLAWDTHREILTMMRSASAALETLASDTQQLQQWQVKLNRMLTSSVSSHQEAGRQMMDGLGIRSVADLSNTDTMASSIRATKRLVDETTSEMRIIAPQNIYKIITGYPGAQQSLIRALGASQSSFIAHCAQLGIERGEFQLSFELWSRAALGVIAGLVVGVVTGGTGIPAYVGLVAGAATSATMGLPSLVSAFEAVDAARVGEASGTMHDQAIESAELNRNVSTGLYIAGIFIPNGVGTYIGEGAGVAAGTGLSAILEIIGGLAPTDRESAGFTALWEKLNSMTPQQRDDMSAAFDAALASKNIPESARPAVLAAFAEANLSSLDKSPNDAAQDLSNYCDTLGRR